MKMFYPANLARNANKLSLRKITQANLCNPLTNLEHWTSWRGTSILIWGPRGIFSPNKSRMDRLAFKWSIKMSWKLGYRGQTLQSSGIAGSVAWRGIITLQPRAWKKRSLVSDCDSMSWQVRLVKANNRQQTMNLMIRWCKRSCNLTRHCRHLMWTW